MLGAGSTEGPIWAVCTALVVAGGNMIKQRHDDKMAKRLTSGNVETSDAQMVWDATMATFKQSEALRHEMSEQIGRLVKDLERWTARAEQWRLRVVDLEDENEELRTRLRDAQEKLNARPTGA